MDQCHYDNGNSPVSTHLLVSVGHPVAFSPIVVSDFHPTQFSRQVCIQTPCSNLLIRIGALSLDPGRESQNLVSPCRFSIFTYDARQPGERSPEFQSRQTAFSISSKDTSKTALLAPILSPTSLQAIMALTVNTYAIKRFYGSGSIHCACSWVMLGCYRGTLSTDVRHRNFNR
jgi:hypothetical protein